MPDPALPPLSRIPSDILCLADYERVARERMDPAVFAWVEGGSGTEQTVRANAAACSRWAIYNRLLVDCAAGSSATHVLGQELAHPVLLAPVGHQRLVHPQGEVATARGAIDTVMVASTMASAPVEDIAAAAAGPLWFQLYLQPHREDSLRLVRRAEDAGCRAIMVTLDTPVQPASHRAQRAGFAISQGEQAALLADNRPTPDIRITADQSMIFQGVMPHAPTRADIAWLRGVTRLPVLAKGVNHPDDAVMLMNMGMDGLVLSNHGGRALDGAPAPLAMLAWVRGILGDHVPLLVDGGLRTGSDVFKAIALGANAVMIGRPQIHALAVAGSLGVAHMLKLLRAELELTMALAGCPTIESITRGALCDPGNDTNRC